jgi:hypothetical protein
MATCIGLFSDQHQAISTEKLRSETKEHPQLPLLYQCTQEKKRPKYLGSKLRAREQQQKNWKCRTCDKETQKL